MGTQALSVIVSTLNWLLSVSYGKKIKWHSSQFPLDPI